ncbi:MAG: Eco29kI family restriction endonuclease [Methylococcales bacterium]
MFFSSQPKGISCVAFDSNLHTFRSPEFQSVVKNAVHFFARTPVCLVPPSQRFRGAGVYALYYFGRFTLYAKLATANHSDYSQPIYVGKAVPPGWRTARITATSGNDLYNRLNEHAGSIQQTANLALDDFRCRFMILGGVESDLVVPVEAELIRTYRPLWNSVVDGFGNHDPGAGRYNQACSEWDVLHPGRTWTVRLTGVPPKLENIIAKVQKQLADSLFS